MSDIPQPPRVVEALTRYSALCRNIGIPEEAVPPDAEPQAFITALLDRYGNEGHCRACPAGITWITHANGAKAPYDADGLNHFASCPARKQFKAKPKA